MRLCSSEPYSGRVTGSLPPSQSQAQCSRCGVKIHGSMPVRTGPSSEPPRAVVPDSGPAVISTMTEDCIRGLQKEKKKNHPHPLHGDLEIWGEGREGTVFCLPNNLISPQSREQKQASCGVNFYPFQTLTLTEATNGKWHAFKPSLMTIFLFLSSRYFANINKCSANNCCYYYYFVNHFFFICLFMYGFIYLFNYFTFGFNVVRPWIHELKNENLMATFHLYASIYIHTHTHTHTYIHIYIYIYI